MQRIAYSFHSQNPRKTRWGASQTTNSHTQKNAEHPYYFGIYKTQAIVCNLHIREVLAAGTWKINCGLEARLAEGMGIKI